jgi:hypothetical protein
LLAKVRCVRCVRLTWTDEVMDMLSGLQKDSRVHLLTRTLKRVSRGLCRRPWKTMLFRAGLSGVKCDASKWSSVIVEVVPKRVTEREQGVYNCNGEYFDGSRRKTKVVLSRFGVSRCSMVPRTLSQMSTWNKLSSRSRFNDTSQRTQMCGARSSKERDIPSWGLRRGI